MSELPSPQDYADRHKRAFREAFDFLNAHFPPLFSAEWWEETIKDIEIAYESNTDNRLQKELLVAVFNYLEHESKLRKEV